MKFLWMLFLLPGVVHTAEMIIKSKGVEFRNPVLSQDGGNVKITTVYGDKVVEFSDLEPIEIQTGNRVYQGYRLEKIEAERIVIGRDGVSIRIKADELNNDCRRLFGYAVEESAEQAPPPAEENKQPSSETPAAQQPAKSAFYLAGEDFREELIRARERFTPPPSTPPPAAREQSRRRPQQQQASAPNVVRNIVFIEDEKKSAGSGFICSLWGIPVIVTNAHVFATAEKPLIQDGMHNQYQPLAVLVSPDRDIALIKVSLPGGISPLALNYRVEELPSGTPLMAYGNALGDEVATNIAGTLRGVGPIRIEITAPIVGGYSGGPILVDNRVIGVNTAGKLVQDNVWMTDSEYETRRQVIGRDRVIEKPVIRRFGTRLDTLVPERLEVFDGEMQYNDLKLYRILNQAVKVFFTELDGHKNPLAPEAVANRIFSPLGDFYNYQSHVKYINELFGDYVELLDLLFAAANISLNYASDAEKQKAYQMFRQIVQHRKEYYDCPVCNGRGQLANPNAKISNDIQDKYARCTECKGQGRSHAVFYDVPRGFNPGVVPIGQGTFGGMRTGWTQAMTRNSLKNEGNWRTIDFAGAVTMLVFDRNPTVNAHATRAFFVMDKLAEISLIFDYSANLLDELEKALGRQFGPPVHKFKKDNFEKVLFKKDGQTVEVFWSTEVNDGRITARWYNNTLFNLKHLLVNDMGNTPHLRSGGGQDTRQQPVAPSSAQSTGTQFNRGFSRNPR